MYTFTVWVTSSKSHTETNTHFFWYIMGWSKLTDRPILADVKVQHKRFAHFTERNHGLSSPFVWSDCQYLLEIFHDKCNDINCNACILRHPILEILYHYLDYSAHEGNMDISMQKYDIHGIKPYCIDFKMAEYVIYHTAILRRIHCVGLFTISCFRHVYVFWRRNTFETKGLHGFVQIKTWTCLELVF